MGKFRIGNRVVRYTVRENSNSNYLVLKLRKDQVLEISIPRDSGLSVERILEKKRPWVEKKYKELLERKHVVRNRRILYRGRAYHLKISRGNKQGVRIHRDKITINVKRGQNASEALKKWMAQKSKNYATRRAMGLAKLLGVKLDFTVDVKDMKSWGRCMDKKNFVFNWQLMGLPARLAGYVVAHELAHLTEGSHSKRFERKLAAISPQYKELREELKSYSVSR